MVADQEPPASSADASSYYDWLPKRGSEEWIQYDFPKAERVSSAQVYWFVAGQAKAPVDWQILYRVGNDWKPVQARDAYRVELDKFNQLTFDPVETSSLRLVLHLQPNYSAGIEEWQVH